MKNPSSFLGPLFPLLLLLVPPQLSLISLICPPASRDLECALFQEISIADSKPTHGGHT